MYSFALTKIRKPKNICTAVQGIITIKTIAGCWRLLSFDDWKMPRFASLPRVTTCPDPSGNSQSARTFFVI